VAVDPASELAARVPGMAERDAVLLDTGILVGLLRRDDAWHARATRWLGGFHGQLHTVEAVLVEAAFFLNPPQRAQLADLAATPVLRLHHPDGAGHARIAHLLRKYADQDRIQGRRKFKLELI
jgi:predicted nucleic acid-binding protein